MKKLILIAVSILVLHQFVHPAENKEKTNKKSEQSLYGQYYFTYLKTPNSSLENFDKPTLKNIKLILYLYVGRKIKSVTNNEDFHPRIKMISDYIDAKNKKVSTIEWTKKFIKKSIFNKMRLAFLFALFNEEKKLTLLAEENIFSESELTYFENMADELEIKPFYQVLKEKSNQTKKAKTQYEKRKINLLKKKWKYRPWNKGFKTSKAKGPIEK